MQTHFPGGAGFSRLGDLVPASPIDALAPSAEPHARAKHGDPSEVRPSPNANADQKISNALAFRGKEGSGEPSGAGPVENPNGPEGFARYLATTFGDTAFRNIAFYRVVVRTVPRHVILDALGRAKDARDVRKSRAHLFAFLVRDHLPKRRTHHVPPI
jgi:hypothetical protein